MYISMCIIKEYSQILFHFLIVFRQVNMLDVCTRSAIVFTVQVCTALSIVVAAYINLSVGDPDQHDLWLVLLASGIGYIFPSPTLNKRTVVVEEEEEEHGRVHTSNLLRPQSPC